MYNFIKFYKDKITVYVYVDEEIDWKETNILDIGFPISDYFNHAVEFSEDLTVKDFVVLLNKYSNEIDMHFSAYNHGLEFDIYHREVLKKQQKDYFKECDEIEIIWETEVQKEEGINFIIDWVSFCGRIKNFKPKHQFDIPTRNMQMSPLRDWKDLPLKLNKMIFYEETSPFQIKRSTSRLHGIKQFNLFDVISGFLYELTCFGTPEQQIIMARDTREQIKNISENLFDSNVSFIPVGAGIINMDEAPIDSVLSKQKKEESIEDLTKKMKKHVDAEEFEKAHEIKTKITKLKSKKKKS